MSLAAILFLVGIADAGTRASITFELATPDAHVVLIHDTDERVIAQFPIRITFDTTQTWSLRATKSGYCPMVAPIDYKHPVIVISLKPGC